jgi:hypothetical protein
LRRGPRLAGFTPEQYEALRELVGWDRDLPRGHASVGRLAVLDDASSLVRVDEVLDPVMAERFAELHDGVDASTLHLAYSGAEGSVLVAETLEGEGVCFYLLARDEHGPSLAGGCGDMEQVARGQAVFVSQDRESDPPLFVGVVSNDAVRVVVDHGPTVAVSNNVWVAVGSESSASYAVIGDDGVGVDVTVPGIAKESGGSDPDSIVAGTIATRPADVPGADHQQLKDTQPGLLNGRNASEHVRLRSRSSRPGSVRLSSDT